MKKSRNDESNEDIFNSDSDSGDDEDEADDEEE